ncbi:MAG: hypothetical protein A2138_22025 [Deltaproteobacteria bacterium RBG_16_71_12]|nr:MAG: hypothetical protein A2138_22025 [Deltaproteobacteria bacterium RBG_16_71_12]
MFGGSAVHDEQDRAAGAPGGLRLSARSSEGCASFAGATATMNGLPMEVSDGEPSWDAFWTRWECGNAAASRSFADRDADAPAEDAEILITGPDAELRVVMADAIGRFRFEFDEDPSVIWPGRAVPFRFVPAAPTSVAFFTLRTDATAQSYDLVVGDDGAGGYVLWVPEDAPLGATEIHARFDLLPAILTCEGSPSCDYLGQRFEAIPTTVVARPREIRPEPEPTERLFP